MRSALFIFLLVQHRLPQSQHSPNQSTGATANRRKLDLRSGGPGTRAVTGNAEYRDADETNLGTRWVAGRWCEPRRFAWEAEALPLDDTRKMSGFRRFYSLTV